jgi:hypothetical protein
MNITHSVINLAGGTLLCAALVAPAAATRLNCDSAGATDVTMWARYLDTGTRSTFDVSVLVPETHRGQLNRQWGLFVDGLRVGYLVLTPRGNGRISASLSFDSYANIGQADAGVNPFPATWPGAGNGTVVRAGNMTCQLTG